MIYTKDHKTLPLFDPWEFLGPKRRKLMDKSWAGLFRKHIFSELPVGKLRPFFTSGFGRPTKELYSTVGAIVLQQMHDLTDEQTVYQVAFNQQWHYALDITESSDEATYLCVKTLWNFRKVMTDNNLDTEVFSQSTEKLAQVFNVDTEKQRLDSVHIKSNMRHLSRIGIFAKSIHKFLVNLKRHYPEQFQNVEQELVDRYMSKKALSCFSMVKPSESANTLEQVSRDLFSLVQLFSADHQVRSMHSYKLLERVLKEQCTTVEAPDDEADSVAIKPPREIGLDSLQNPSDPDAGYDSHKGKGYQVQVMETYNEETDPEEKSQQLNLITHVEVETASAHDAKALMPAIESTQIRGLAPQQVLCDKAYGGEDNCQAAQEQGVEVISPVMGTAAKTHGLVSFEYGDQGEVLSCAQGNKPIKVKKRKNRHTAVFSTEHCARCPFLSQCNVKQGKRRFYLHYDDKARRCAQRRVHEQTDEFRERYRWRAGVEATMSEYNKLTGVKQLRVRGLKAVRFCAVLKAVAVNIMRATAVKMALTRPNEPAQAINPAQNDLICVFKERFMTYWGKAVCFFLARPKIYRFGFKIVA
jgi:hypothetical protein